MLRQLEQIHRGPLPAGLIPRVKAWAHHYGDGALEDVVLLQLDNPAILAELMAEPDMAGLLRAPPSRPAAGPWRAYAARTLKPSAPAWPSAASTSKTIWPDTGRRGAPHAPRYPEQREGSPAHRHNQHAGRLSRAAPRHRRP